MKAITADQLERHMQVAKDIKKEFLYNRSTGKWAWVDRGDEADYRFDSFLDALLDAVEPYTSEEFLQCRHNLVIEVEGGVVQDVHDLPDDWTYEIKDHDAEIAGDDRCRYCGGNCPNDEDNACDGYSGDIDGLYT